MKDEVIVMNNIKRVYNAGMVNELEILHGISLSIKENEFVAIVGSSGAGKSTLMNVIGLLDSPTSGNYILNQRDTSGLSDDEMSEIRNIEIGFVFQNFNLIPRLSAQKNIELPMLYKGYSSSKRSERAKMLLEMVGMGERSKHLPNQLSGGQQQRVAIARAMANDPTLILADEPTGALDSETGKMIMEIFHDLNRKQGKTIVLITHSMELAQQTDRIITLSDGRIVSDTAESML
ncbi:ABC transporter ATP-binding protein [Ruminococcus flavefaciens]|uniref:ABC transporter ATP-binding protein n=1 Tax=Ruminococcus flavefaciens TaxID=1265 RepID=UPI003F070E1E